MKPFSEFIRTTEGQRAGATQTLDGALSAQQATPIGAPFKNRKPVAAFPVAKWVEVSDAGEAAFRKRDADAKA